MRVLNEAAEFCEALYDGIICYNYIHELYHTMCPAIMIMHSHGCLIISRQTRPTHFRNLSAMRGFFFGRSMQQLVRTEHSI